MMRDGRISTSLKEILVDVIDYRGRTPKKLGGDFSDEGIPVISAKNVKNGSLDFSEGIRYVNPEMYERWMSKKLREGDVLLTSEAPLGQAILLTNELNYCLGQRLYGLRVDSTKLDSRFFYFLLISEPVQRGLQARATGSTAKGIKQSALLEVHIEFPPLPEQRAIAHVLQTIQEAKFARQRELALERERKAALMDYLFSYGTKGEPRKQTEIGEIPESWEVVRLGEIVTLQRGKDLPVQSRQAEDIPIVGSNGIVGWHNKPVQNAPVPGVATGRSGSIGLLTYIDQPYWPLNTALYVRDFHGNNPLFVYHWLHLFPFERYSQGVSVPTLNRNLVHPIPFRLPSLSEQAEIAEILQASDKKIVALEQEVKYLDELFHAMLDELMTGQRSAVPLIDAELPN